MTTRHQDGHIYEKHGAFHLRYYVTEMRDGKLTRVQRSRKLCDKDSRDHRYPTSKAVRGIADAILLEVNKDAPPTGDDVRIATFWTSQYLPYCESGYKGRGMRPSSVRGFRQVWRQHLEPHFGDTALKAYTSTMARQFLSSLKTKQCRNTLRHIRGLASAMFAEAVERGLCAANPWAGVKIPKDCKDSKPKGWYTQKQVVAMVAALREYPDMQAVIAIVCWLGLRPGECNALRWEDITNGIVHVQRSVVRGIVGVPKTEESVRHIPMVAQVKQRLAVWWDKSGRPKEGWVFPSEGVLTAERCAPEMQHLVGGPAPLDLHNSLSRFVIPTLKKKGIVWRGLYSGRRGAITMVIENTNGNYAVAQALAGHKRMTTTLDVYKQAITAEGFAAGMREYEQKMLKAAK
jgi:integrase